MKEIYGCNSKTSINKMLPLLNANIFINKRGNDFTIINIICDTVSIKEDILYFSLEHSLKGTFKLTEIIGFYVTEV